MKLQLHIVRKRASLVRFIRDGDATVPGDPEFADKQAVQLFQDVLRAISDPQTPLTEVRALASVALMARMESTSFHAVDVQPPTA